jgi:hypothetical protein
VALICCAALSACALGERPYFEDDPLASGTPTGDADIDAVLTKLDSVTAQAPLYTASYTTVVRFGGAQHTASIASDGSRKSTTIDQIRFITESGAAQTCDLTTGACNDGLLTNQVSNSLLTPDFFSADAARRLRRDAQAKVGPTSAYTLDIVGQPASCIDVNVTGGPAVYCVLGNGLLAKLVDGDITIDIQTYTATPAPEQFDTKA